MSIKTLHENTIENRDLTVNTEAWVRNPSWLTLPTVTGTEQKFVGLYAVWPGDTNPVTIKASSGYNYSFYTGGGLATGTSGSTQPWNYSYDDPDLSNTNAPVTLNNSIVTRNSHGYSDRMRVDFHNIVTTTGISSGVYYYVVNSTQNTFQISLTQDGVPVVFTGSGTATLLPYKQTIVTIVPQVGQNLTSLDLSQGYTTYSPYVYSTGWLDINLGSPNLSSLSLSSSGQVRHTNLERCSISNIGTLTSLNGMFQDSFSLQSVPLFDTSNVTNMNLMFSGCTSLQSVPLFNTSNVMYMNSMFYGCASLQSVPLFNTSSVTTMMQMFVNCKSLRTVPLFNTSNVLTMQNMFGNCSSLQSVPLFDTSKVQYILTMFSGCTSLQSVPSFNTSSVIYMNSMFNGCSSLKSVPSFNTSSVNNSNVNGLSSMFINCKSLQTAPYFEINNITTLSSMFQGCTSLKSIPSYDTNNIINMSGMFSGCTSLQSVPLFNTSNVTNTSSMFDGCTSLQSVPSFNLSSVTNLTNMFNGCLSISSISMTNPRISFSVANCNLSGPALNTIYSNLGTGVTGQVITVSGNWGTTLDNPALVPVGWIVTG